MCQDPDYSQLINGIDRYQDHLLSVYAIQLSSKEATWVEYVSAVDEPLPWLAEHARG